MSDVLEILAALRTSVLEPTGPATWESPAAAGALGVVRDDSELEPVLQRRHALRYFHDEPLPAQVLLASAEAARSIDAVLWPSLHTSQPLRFMVAARHVTGLTSGVFEITPDGFRPEVALPDAGVLADMVLQPEFAEAPALFLVVGSLEAAVREDGGHGHRVLLERSGAAAESAWLAAVDRGFGGSIFAGFLPSALRRFTGIDGYRRTQLLALALGVPIGASAQERVTSPCG